MSRKGAKGFLLQSKRQLNIDIAYISLKAGFKLRATQLTVLIASNGETRAIFPTEDFSKMLHFFLKGR